MDRFWDKVDKSGECWMWTAAKGRGGYGNFTLDGRSINAHRASYILNVGPIPAGAVVRHQCDTPLCVNPSHLQLGSYSDNTQDMVRRGRAASGERHGHAKTTNKQNEHIRDLIGQGMTQQAVADMFGITQSTVSRMMKAYIA